MNVYVFFPIPRLRPSKWHAWLRRGLLLQQPLKSTELPWDRLKSTP